GRAGGRQIADLAGPEEIEILLEGAGAPGGRDLQAPEDVDRDRAERRPHAGADKQRADRELRVRARGQEELGLRGASRARDQQRDQERASPPGPQRTLPARTPRPSGRGGAPISRVDCPRVELSTRSASGPGENQAVGPLRQPSTRRWGWTGR